MKRTLLFIACVLASLTMLAQEYDYIPFVKAGKRWHVVRSEFDKGYHFDQFTLMNEKVEKAGKTYFGMYRTEDLLAVVYDAGLLREEDRKVYFFDSDMQKEFLLFDYSLKTDDTYETYSYDEQRMVSYKVVSVGDYWEGPKVERSVYNQAADSAETQQRFLQKWIVCRTDNEAVQKTWIEGVGSLEGPLANLYDVSPVSVSTNLAYVEFGDELYLPFSFYDTMNKQVHGCNLPTGAENREDDDTNHHLIYELEGNRLHVYGEVFTQCGPNNYAYFIEKPTDDPTLHKLEFIIQDVAPSANCMALHATNFYATGFDPNLNYVVVDNRGEKHPVINKTPQMAYRPFVEEGKVWKEGDVSDNPVKLVEYYYFEGDTIINGKTCKQMMCQRYVGSDHLEYDPLLRKIGAWYEEDKKVYEYDTNDKQFKLMYDFSANAHDTLQINGQLYIIGARQTGGLKGFKGVYRDVTNHMAWKTTWLEGVGGLFGFGPSIDTYPGQSNPAWALMSCTVGDEVIYLNDEYEDGVTPDLSNAPRQRLDFTHIIKSKPRAPMMRTAEQPLYGEYNNQQLGINLDPLDEAYLVRITNESGKTVYEKAINAGNIVGLSIDISAYPKGCYTVTIENSREAFTGQFYAQTTGIVEATSKKPEVKDGIYNLQGQRISSLQKGLNIVNGRKVYVK